MKIKYEKKKKLLLGIEILRMFFAFMILFFHCRNRKIYSTFFISYLTQIVAVGLELFLIISFHFSYNSFTSKNINKINERFKRLLFPYIIWPIIIYLQRALFNHIYFKKNFKFLIYQILIGNGLYCIFWFNFNLIFILLFFAIEIFITKKYMTFLILFGFIIFLISSSNLYAQFWKGFKFDIYFSVGKVINTYRLGLIGFLLASTEIIKIKITKQSLIFCIFILLLLIIRNIDSIKLIPKYYFSIPLLLIFANIPCEKLSINTYTFIKQLSSYTGGIYYIHVYIYLFLKKYIALKSISGNIFMCIIHYFLCYFLCFIGYNIFKNTNLKYLFY